jgi:hypothetical protein
VYATGRYTGDGTAMTRCAQSAASTSGGAAQGSICPSHGGVRGNDPKKRNDGGYAVGGATVEHMTDGSSNTVMVAEVFRGKSFWATSPGSNNDITGNRCRSWIAVTGFCGVDGSRSPNDSRRDEVDWSDDHRFESWGPRPASSSHEGGIHGLFGDGAARFISENIDLGVWRNTISRRGAESTTLEF